MSAHWFRTYLFVFFSSLVLSLGLTPVIRMLAQRLNIYDIPDKRKIHTRAIPLWGGIAVYIPFAVSIVLSRHYSKPLEAIVLCGLIALLIGVLDDLKKVLSGTVKFFILIGLTLLVIKYGVVVKILPAANVYFRSINIVLTILWIVGVTSAFNAIDNMDGLATGVAVITSTFFSVVAIQTHNLLFGTISIALAGSCLGFLKYNFKPATIFLGDAGSFFIGFSLAAMSIMGDWSSNPIISAAIPVFILGIPIFDISYVVITRHVNKVTKTFFEALKHCAQDHLSHRLVALGCSQKKAVLVIYLMSICTGICAIVLRNSTDVFDTVLLMLQGVIALLLGMEIMHIGTMHLKDKYLISENFSKLTQKLGVEPKKINVLVVDDDSNVREFIADFLVSKGFEAKSAPEGESALEIIKNNGIDLVLLDIVLPGKYSGIDVLRQIKKTRKDIPVIMITGYSTLKHEIDELNYDAFGEIQKPFKLEDLEAVISKALKDTKHDYINVVLGETKKDDTNDKK